MWTIRAGLLNAGVREIAKADQACCGSTGVSGWGAGICSSIRPVRENRTGDFELLRPQEFSKKEAIAVLHAPQ
jgi:hypothetical protein